MSSNKNVPFYVPAAASILNGFLFAPLELASTRSKSADATTKSFRLLAEIIRKEGMASLWKGSGWFITGTAISRGLWLSSYNRIKNYLDYRLPLNQSIIGASLLSGMSVALISNPVWTLKSYAQLPNYPGLLCSGIGPSDRMKLPLVQENRRLTLQPRVLMSGAGAAMCYVGIESVSQLFLYEKLKLLYKRQIDSTEPIAAPIAGLIGGVSRAAMLPFTYPLHVLTLRYRENAKPIISTVNGMKIITENKNRQNLSQILRRISVQNAWYDGGLAYTARVIPQATVLFFCYEFFQRILA